MKESMKFESKPDEGTSGFSESDKNLEYEDDSIDRVNKFLSGVDSATDKTIEELNDEEKFNLIIRTLQDLFRFYNLNSIPFNLQQKAIESAYLIALARIRQTENELNKKETGGNTPETHIMGTVGHCLSHGFDGIKRLVPKKVDAEQLPEPIKKIAEFIAKFYESMGSFTQAYEYYQYSYPDKYRTMIEAIEASRFNKEVMAGYMHSDPDFERKTTELKTSFLSLLNSIGNDPLIQSNVLEETRRLAKDCSDLVITYGSKS